MFILHDTNNTAVKTDSNKTQGGGSPNEHRQSTDGNVTCKERTSESWYSPEDGKEEQCKHVSEVEVKPEEADYEVSRRHSAYGGERVPDVRRSEQTQNELDRVLRVTEAQLDHVRETAVQ